MTDERIRALERHDTGDALEAERLDALRARAGLVTRRTTLAWALARAIDDRRVQRAHVLAYVDRHVRRGEPLRIGASPREGNGNGVEMLTEGRDYTVGERAWLASTSSPSGESRLLDVTFRPGALWLHRHVGFSTPFAANGRATIYTTFVMSHVDPAEQRTCPHCRGWADMLPTVRLHAFA